MPDSVWQIVSFFVAEAVVLGVAMARIEATRRQDIKRAVDQRTEDIVELQVNRQLREILQRLSRIEGWIEKDNRTKRA